MHSCGRLVTVFTERRRAITICLAGVAMNACLSIVARQFELPLWLDTTGTIYAAMILGFPYGFVVGLINNLFWTVLTNGYNSFAYYVVSIAVAYLAAKLTPQPVKLTPRAFIVLFIGLFVVGAMLASLTTIIVDGGMPTDYWGQRLRLDLLDGGFDPVLSCLFAVSIVKANDTLITLLIVAIGIACTPIKYRDEKRVMR